MNPLTERLLGIRHATVTILGQFSGARGELVQGAASLCNCASQMVYQHPWGMEAHALAKLFLPASIRNFLDTNVVTDTDNLIYKPSMQALAMSGKLASLMRQSSSRCEIAVAPLPGEPDICIILDVPSSVVVLRDVG